MEKSPLGISNYFLSKPSTEYFPGPAKKRNMNIKINNNGFSLDPKESSACAIKAATDIVTINGIKEILVKKPAAKNMVQKNSAKMAICKDKAEPKPIGSLNLVS